MHEKQFMFTGSHSQKLHAVIWEPNCSPVAVVQITHGMSEHILCYSSFAQHLTTHGIAVAGFDLRGHGKNFSPNQYASFGEEGWEATLQDMHLFHDYLMSKFPNVKLIMFGFSLGSFLLREYLASYDDSISGAILMGTGQKSRLLLSLVQPIVKLQINKCGFDNTTRFVTQLKLSFGAYNRKFQPIESSSDWLCADSEQRDLLLRDPLCRKDISAGLFLQLLSAMKRTGRIDTYQRWNKELPLLLLSGEDDPIGGYGKYIYQIVNRLHHLKFINMKFYLFPKARHVILREKISGTSDCVEKIIIEWILENI